MSLFSVSFCVLLWHFDSRATCSYGTNLGWLGLVAVSLLSYLWTPEDNPKSRLKKSPQDTQEKVENRIVFHVIASRIWHIDETTAALLPVIAGWKRKGRSGSREIPGDNRAWTVLAAIRPAPSSLLSQVIFVEKTFASSGSLPRNITTTSTECPWSRQGTQLKAVEMIDKVMKALTFPLPCQIAIRGRATSLLQRWPWPGHSTGPYSSPGRLTYGTAWPSTSQST